MFVRFCLASECRNAHIHDTMAFNDEIAELEREVKEASLPIEDVLDKAGVHRSSWTRWKNGTHSPRMDNWSMVRDTARRLIAEKRAAA